MFPIFYNCSNPSSHIDWNKVLLSGIWFGIMAQLLSPVCMEALKIHNPSLNLCSRGSWRMLVKTPSHCTFVTQSGKRRGCGRVRVTAEDSVSPTDTIADDYYAVLGLVMHQTLTSFSLLSS